MLDEMKALGTAWDAFLREHEVGYIPGKDPLVAMRAAITAYLAALPVAKQELGYHTEAQLTRDGPHLELKWWTAGIEHDARIYEPNDLALSSALADVLALAVEVGQAQFGTTLTALRSASPLSSSQVTEERIAAAWDEFLRHHEVGYIPGKDPKEAMRAAISVALGLSQAHTSQTRPERMDTDEAGPPGSVVIGERGGTRSPRLPSEPSNVAALSPVKGQ